MQHAYQDFSLQRNNETKRFSSIYLKDLFLAFIHLGTAPFVDETFCISGKFGLKIPVNTKRYHCGLEFIFDGERYSVFDALQLGWLIDLKVRSYVRVYISGHYL